MEFDTKTEAKLELMEEHLKRLLSESINLRCEQTERSERQLAQYREVRKQIKSIVCMVNICAFAGVAYITGLISARWF